MWCKGNFIFIESPLGGLEVLFGKGLVGLIQLDKESWYFMALNRAKVGPKMETANEMAEWVTANEQLISLCSQKVIEAWIRRPR